MTDANDYVMMIGTETVLRGIRRAGDGFLKSLKLCPRLLWSVSREAAGT
jgi:hypothetical protein